MKLSLFGLLLKPDSTNDTVGGQKALAANTDAGKDSFSIAGIPAFWEAPGAQENKADPWHVGCWAISAVAAVL